MFWYINIIIVPLVALGLYLHTDRLIKLEARLCHLELQVGMEIPVSPVCNEWDER